MPGQRSTPSITLLALITALAFAPLRSFIAPSSSCLRFEDMQTYTYFAVARLWL
jgi:hypothetical protein